MQLHESGGLYTVYEVFVQADPLSEHEHVGSVLATSPDMALLVGRENFLRRSRAHSLWVVAKDAIAASPSEDSEFFACEFDRAYRRVDGYADNAKRWKAFKQQALDMKEILGD